MNILPGSIRPHNRVVTSEVELSKAMFNMVANMALGAYSSGVEYFYDMKHVHSEMEYIADRFKGYGGTFYVYIRCEYIAIGNRDVLALFDEMEPESNAGFRFDIVLNQWLSNYTIDCERVHDRYNWS